MIKVEDLVTYYGEVQMLKGVNLKVDKGEIVVIIGPNGAGKSTVLKAICGIVKAVQGSITYKGEDITNIKTQELVKLGIGYVPQGRAVFPNLTVQENLLMGAYTRKDNDGIKDDIEQMYERFPKLREQKNTPATLLSGGGQQMLALARALMTHPRLLILDEPSLGLSPQMIEVILEKIQEINREGVTILMVEQNAHMALEFAHRGYVLELGENRLEGSGAELLNNPTVKKLYLGEAFVEN
jgi:branched-chain amino acid transport system ATP-binding protein